MLTLKGRTALVTGCSGNIGKALIPELAKAGMNLILCSHGPHKGDTSHKNDRGPGVGPDGQKRKNPLEAAIENLPEGCNGIYTYIQPVVEDEDDVKAKFAEAAAITGGIDCIIMLHGRSAEYKEQSFETLDTDYVTKTLMNHAAFSYMGIRQALPYLEKSPAGRVVLFANSEARSGSENSCMAVSMAKGAVISLTYNAAKRLAPKGIPVNCVAMGGIMNVPAQPGAGRGSGKNAAPGTTVGAANWILEEELYDVNTIPVGRLGKNEDVTNAICYLLSEEAGYVTGEVLNVSGGLYMG